MRGCIRIPRFRVPRTDAEAWPARLGEEREGTVSDYFLPAGLEGEQLNAAVARIRENEYSGFWRDSTDKLARGLILTERTLPCGVRRGIVAAFDLEEFSLGKEVSAVRIASMWDAERAKELVSLRAAVPAEFPSAVVLYRDKKGKALAEAEGDLEQLYDFSLPAGRIVGKFIPDHIAQGVAAEMYSRGEPCFVVADGLEEAAAAKAHWESLKTKLTKEQQRNHPARFFAAEFLNVYGGAVRLAPVHRFAAGVDPALVAESFAKNFRFKRQGNAFVFPAVTPENVARCDALLGALAASVGGEIVPEPDAERAAKRAQAENAAAVIFSEIDRDALFTPVRGELPMPYFTVGGAGERRYCLEGREISYD